MNTLREKAKKEDMNIEVVQADLRYFKLDRLYPLIILPFQSMQELISRKDHLKALERIWVHLQENGQFIVSIHNPGYHSKSNDRSIPLKEFRDNSTGNIVKFYYKRTVEGHLATNEQLYREYSGKEIISERKFINMSYVFLDGEFEGLIKEAGFRVEQVWGGYSYEAPKTDSRFLIYNLTRK